MKKLAIATVIALASAAASAQVSVYGVLDTSVQSFNTGKETVTRMQDNLFNTSRLGFKGSEELSNGLKINFQLEGQLNPGVGSVGSTTVATNEFFNREAWVGLSGGFGEFRFGRTDMTESGELDVRMSQAGNFGLHAVNGTGVELGTDQKNVIKYISPRIAGLSLQLANASNVHNAVTDSQATQNSVSLDYLSPNGKFKAGVAYQKNDGATKAAEKYATSVGAAYDFGQVSIGLAHVEGDNSTTAEVLSKSTVVSAKVPLAQGFAVHGVYAQSIDGAKTSANKGESYTALVTKEFSKRTTVYAAYTAINNQANSSMSMYGAGAPSATGLDTSGVSIGISHKF